MFNKPALPPQELPTGVSSKNQAPTVSTATSEDVYVMPEKFHSEPVKGPTNKPLIIAVAVLAAVVIIVAAYFFYDSAQKAQLAKNQAAENAAQQSSTPVVEDVNVPAPTPEPEPVEPVVEPVAPTTTEPVVEPVAPTTTEPALVTPTISRDSDSDGLTDMEEDVIGTASNKPDSDADGYTDSAELMTGYNPLSNSSNTNPKLPQADFIAKAISQFAQNNFSFLYPKNFKVSFIDENSQAMISADTGEIIRISSMPNEQKISAMNWYLQLHPQATVSQLKAIETKNLSGFFTENGLTAYLTDANKDRIYSFEYMTSPQTEFRYPNIFTMIIQNFQVVASTSTAAGQ